MVRDLGEVSDGFWGEEVPGGQRRRSEPSRGLKLAEKLTQGKYDAVKRARVESLMGLEGFIVS
jgi:hypothetical protein